MPSGIMNKRCDQARLRRGALQSWESLWESWAASGGNPHYEQALRIKPDYAEAHNNLGSALADGQDRGSHRALRAGPADQARLRRGARQSGDRFGEAGRIEEAIAHYQQALRIKPDYAEAHYNLGNVFLREGKISDAIGHYEQALRIKPDYAEAHNNLGFALQQSGRTTDAIAHYEQALRLRPDFAVAHVNLGNALAKLGRDPEAIRHYQQALEIDPRNAEAHYELANAQLRVGNASQAITHYTQSLQIDPGNSEAHSKFGIALLATGNIHDALDQWEQALRITRTWPKSKTISPGCSQPSRPRKAATPFGPWHWRSGRASVRVIVRRGIWIHWLSPVLLRAVSTMPSPRPRTPSIWLARPGKLAWRRRSMPGSSYIGADTPTVRPSQ